ncbi:MAG: sodium:proton antiporter NhaD [Petrimonas sp.]|nr:sodium:proton antiporter NhaD [Petrimonas sp.]
MIVLMIAIFLIGYALIAMEHPLRINKAGVALFIGSLLWVIYMYVAPEIVPKISEETFRHFVENHDLTEHSFIEQIRNFVINHQILEDLGDIMETILFLMGAMTIVELIDSHGGFMYITEHITTRNKKKLLWIVSAITFFMSALLDNLTTTIVMVMLMRRILTERQERWLFGSIIVLAANSGGAWSPIGDVTTIMLWVKGNVTVAITPSLILPSIVSLVIPVLIAQTFIKGRLSGQTGKETNDEHHALIENLQDTERLGILIFGIGILVLTPVFKIITHLPPFIWLLLGMSLLWILTEIIYNRKRHMQEDSKMRLTKVLGRLDFATLMFFLGILMAVDALKNAGILSGLSAYMAQHMPNVYAQGFTIGILSSIVDNVPLVAAAIGMYPVIDPATITTASNAAFMQNFVVDGTFWHFLAYCAGVGGSILVIGSAAGVILMGLEGVSFGWYLKKISLMALIGYVGGAAVFILQNMILH